MAWDWKNVWQLATAGVIGAGLIAAVGALWNWGSSGGLIRSLGGVTPAEAESIARNATVHGPAGPPTSAIPPGIVIAATKKCEELGSGWKRFDKANGRVIIGVQERSNPPRNTIREADLTLLQDGGTKIKIVPWSGESSIFDAEGKQHYEFVIEREAHAVSRTYQYYLLPPYIAVYYCERVI